MLDRYKPVCQCLSTLEARIMEISDYYSVLYFFEHLHSTHNPLVAII